MNQNYKELKKNTLTIAAANMGSKIISFLLAPLYSYFMSTPQYGTMDLINTTIGLVLPFVCLDVYEATFRYSSDSNYDKQKVLSSSLLISGPGIVIVILIALIGLIIPTNFSAKYLLIVCICAILGAINYVIAQFLRGSNKMVTFAMSGVISSLALLVSNFVLLILMNKSLYGWLLSFLISKIVETLYLCIASDIFKVFSFKAIDKSYIREFLKFCLPLMPTATMWWIMNLSDRYMLAFFMGTAATGIYAVANKLPGLLSIFENIFYQAWQTTAINTLNYKNRDNFYSNVFNNYFSFLSIGVLGILVVSKPMILLLFADVYESAWKYISLLIIGVVVHALNGNLGSLYSVFKDTKGAFYSTIIGAITNIVLNVLFIPIIGIMGAALATLIGYVVTFIYRWHDTKKFVHIELKLNETIIFVILMAIQLGLYYVPGIWSYAIRCIIVSVSLICKRDLFFKILTK